MIVGNQMESVRKMDLIINDVKLSNYRKNVEKEFYNSFKIFFWTNQFFCTIPLDLNLLQSPPGLKMKILSRLHLVYGLLICACVSVATFWQHQQFDTSIGFLTGVLYMGEYIFGTITVLLVIVGCHYHKKSYKIFFDRLVKVDLNLQKCGVQPNFDSTLAYMKRCLIAFTIFFTIVTIVDALSNDPRADSYILSSSVYTIPNMVTSLALIQYAIAFHYIQDKLRTINAILKRLATNKKFMDHQSLVNNKLDIISVFSMNIGQNGNYKILNILRKQHAELSRLVEVLCKAFGEVIILTFLVAYAALSSQLYEIYRISVGFDNVLSWFTGYTVLWVILNCGKVIVILYPANVFTDERKLTGNLLYELDIAEKISNNSRPHVMINAFSQQLLHETSTPNALRIVNLDMTNTATMLGVLTTYLIILIQFDINTRDQSGKVSNTTGA